MISSLNRISGVALFFLLAGCTTVPQRTHPLIQQILTFSPPPGKANIYVVRPYNFLGACCAWDATLDSKIFGLLNLGSYLYRYVDPDDHVVGVSVVGEPTGYAANSLRFTTVAGRNYFFKVSISLDFGPIHIEALSEKEGRRRVLESKISERSLYDLISRSRSSPP